MRVSYALAAALIAIGSSACSGREDRAPGPEALASTEPETSVEPSPIASLTPTPTPTPVAVPSSVERAAGDPTEIRGLIDGFVHGGRAWGVYLWGGEWEDPGYEEAIQFLRDLGLKEGVEFSYGGQCDQGAQKAFGDDLPAAFVAAYFTKGKFARRFAGSLDPPPVGVAHVTTYCAD